MSSGSTSASAVEVAPKQVEDHLKELVEGQTISPVIAAGFALRNYNVTVHKGEAKLTTSDGGATIYPGHQGFGKGDNLDYRKGFEVSGGTDCLATVSWEISAV